MVALTRCWGSTLQATSYQSEVCWLCAGTRRRCASDPAILGVLSSDLNGTSKYLPQDQGLFEAPPRQASLFLSTRLYHVERGVPYLILRSTRHSALGTQHSAIRRRMAWCTNTRFLDLWEVAQVELRGRYSLTRFHEILEHAKQTSRWQQLGIILLTPLPGLLSIVTMDVLPLSPPEDGIFHQSISFFLRTFLTTWLMGHMMLMQIHASSPTLPLSTGHHWAISLTTALVALAGMICIGWFVAFPTPFSINILLVPNVSVFTLGVWMTWKDAFSADAEAKRKVLHYVRIVFGGQQGMFFVYTCFTIAFNNIPSQYQTWFTLFLPAIKLAFKNWVIKGVLYMEDLAPTIVVFNVDVFHAIFVSSTMQGASSWGSVAVVMAVDLIQAAVSYYEVSKLYQLVNALAIRILSRQRHTDTFERRTQSELELKRGVIDYALDLIDRNPGICGHQDLALPRHRRVSQLQSSQVAPSTAVPTTTDIPKPCRPVAGTNTRIVAVLPTERVRDTNDTDTPLSPAEDEQLQCVKGVLKLLHMIEFYVLIEFAEVIIPMINAVYLRVLVYLPSRVYYWSLDSLTRDELSVKANRIAIYASLELVSFVLFCYIMDRRLRHTSTYQMLAFVLTKHSRMSQSTLAMWMFFLVQIGLKHLGIDFTFQFKWLQGNPNS